MFEDVRMFYDYAKSVVWNKDRFSRIKNSETVDPLRRVFFSEADAETRVMKVVRSLGKLGGHIAVDFIPIPVLKSITSVLYGSVTDGLRSKSHDIKRAAAQKRVEEAIAQKKEPSPRDLAEAVKFELKDMSVESLDRYRWKLGDALLHLYVDFGKYPERNKNAEKKCSTCDPLAGMAISIAQVERRYTIMTGHIEELQHLLKQAQDWADATRKEMDKLGVKAEFKERWLAKYNRDLQLINAGKRQDAAKYHANCGKFCYFEQRPFFIPPETEEKLTSKGVLKEAGGGALASLFDVVTDATVDAMRG